MGDLKDQVSKEIILAMKAKDKIRLNVLRYVKKLFIENDTSKSPKKELDVVIGYAKKVKDSLSLYPEGSEQRKEIELEVKVLSEYLPKQLEEASVKTMIDEIIKKLDSPNMGMVMKELSPLIKGQFDGRKATQLVISSLK